VRISPDPSTNGADRLLARSLTIITPSSSQAPFGLCFAAAGLARPDISILSDEFLAEVRGLPQRNLAVELLQKLLHGELVKRIVRRHGYPPDKQEAATRTVLEQVEVWLGGWMYAAHLPLRWTSSCVPLLYRTNLRALDLVVWFNQGWRPHASSDRLWPSICPPVHQDRHDTVVLEMACVGTDGVYDQVEPVPADGYDDVRSDKGEGVATFRRRGSRYVSCDGRRNPKRQRIVWVRNRNDVERVGDLRATELQFIALTLEHLVPRELDRRRVVVDVANHLRRLPVNGRSQL